MENLIVRMELMRRAVVSSLSRKGSLKIGIYLFGLHPSSLFALITRLHLSSSCKAVHRLRVSLQERPVCLVLLRLWRGGGLRRRQRWGLLSTHHLQLLVLPVQQHCLCSSPMGLRWWHWLPRWLGRVARKLWPKEPRLSYHSPVHLSGVSLLQWRMHPLQLEVWWRCWLHWSIRWS